MTRWTWHEAMFSGILFSPARHPPTQISKYPKMQFFVLPQTAMAGIQMIKLHHDGAQRVPTNTKLGILYPVDIQHCTNTVLEIPIMEENSLVIKNMEVVRNANADLFPVKEQCISVLTRVWWPPYWDPLCKAGWPGSELQSEATHTGPTLSTSPAQRTILVLEGKRCGCWTNSTGGHFTKQDYWISWIIALS